MRASGDHHFGSMLGDPHPDNFDKLSVRTGKSLNKTGGVIKINNLKPGDKVESEY